MATGYTQRISYYKRVEGLGWVFESIKTTDDSARPRLRNLLRQQAAGQVRTIERVRLK